MNQRLKITKFVGHIEETMPNGPLKIKKSLLRSTQAGHIKFYEYRLANIRKQ